MDSGIQILVGHPAGPGGPGAGVFDPDTYILGPVRFQDFTPASYLGRGTSAENR